MKSLITKVLLSVAFLSILSCQKTKQDINKATEFTMNYTTEVAVPASSISVTTPAEFTTPDVPTQSTSRFASESTTKSLIDEITMTKLVLSTQTGNLDYIKSFSIFIKGTGLGDVLVASKSNIPAGSTTISADLTGTNIKEHIFNDAIKFRVSVTVNTALSSDQKLKVDGAVTVKGKKV